MTGRLNGKVAIVVGAGASEGGTSIGMATAIVFAREGARVFAVDRDISLARDSKHRIEEAGGTCALHECDVGDSASVAGMAKACVETFGRIDVLFNNVGIFLGGGPLETSDEQFDRIWNINTRGVFLAIRAVLPAMLAQGNGAIVNNASVSAIRYQFPAVAYNASKAAILQITQNVGLQYAARGIRCNAVMPGNILNDRMVARLKRQHGEKHVDHITAWAEQVPSGVAGEPWDVAHAVLFLASDEAKYVNATHLIVDGGLSSSAVGKALR
jgi:NAD(P)-dependent dehydrogenase (short-subunit alcohol dehydrogenase family)